ncbi:MAG TPA: methyltransferase domain-containing protein [Anaerolineales bacterium]|nr:methyltransferase domain-containing protein [Anaerolineales bacterium]
MPPHTFKSGWAGIDTTPDPQRYVRFMDRLRYHQDDDPAQYEPLFESLNPVAGEHILDVGCGTGGAVRAIARRVAGIGRVIGVDNSATMIVAAAQRAERLALPVEFRTADAGKLLFENDSFDACFSIGLMEVVPDPRAVLAEMVRVIRPGGRVFINTHDAGMMGLDSDHREATRKIINFACDHEANGWIGRQLFGLCFEAGLDHVRVAAWPWVTTDFNLAFDLWLNDFMAHAREAGAISATEAEAWIDDLKTRHAAGRFFLCQIGFTATATKPLRESSS